LTLAINLSASLLTYAFGQTQLDSTVWLTSGAMEPPAFSQPLHDSPMGINPIEPVVTQEPKLPTGLPAASSSTKQQSTEDKKKFAWSKGDYTIVPYGVLSGSAIYVTNRCVPGPFILYVASQTLEGEDDFVIDTRRTRMGFDVTGPRVPLF